MQTLKVILYSTKKRQRILYSDEHGEMLLEIERAFLRKCDVLNFVPGGARIMVCEKTRNALLALEKKYEQATKKHIRKLRGFIADLTDNEHFYFFNEDKTSLVDRRIAIEMLNWLNNKVSYSEVLHNRVFEHFNNFNIQYEFLSYGHDGLEERIGEKDISKRICRFCKKSIPEVTFNNNAHAIQDALGNKIIFCNEECDSCNHNLAPVEDQFRIMMDFRRSIFRIPRKETTKAAKIIGKDFIILPDKNGNPNLYLMQDSFHKIDITKPFMHHFELKAPVVNEKMYKALCKMVIDMLPSCELPHFENTIKWISSNNFIPDYLPSIWLGNLPTDKPVYKQPALDIYINNREKQQQAPYCTAIIWIYDIAYLFVVPLVDVDAGKYKYDANLKSHIKKMKQWTGLENWHSQDTNNYHFSTAWVDWLVDPSLINIHIRLKSDEVFKDCLVEKLDSPHISMPDVKNEYLSLSRIESVTFESLYNDKITDEDLMDITQSIAGPVFIIDKKNQQVNLKLKIDAFDTTYKIPFFKFSFSVDIHIDHFEDYIQIIDEKSFSFHYQLRDKLFKFALDCVEPEMQKQRAGTQFEKCSLYKLEQCFERLLDNSLYLVPFKDNGYMAINDYQIHCVDYQ